MELTVVHGLINHVNFTIHVRGASLDPVLTDLFGDSVLYSKLNKVGSPDHNAVNSTKELNSAQEKENQRTVWPWECAN